MATRGVAARSQVTYRHNRSGRKFTVAHLSSADADLVWETLALKDALDAQQAAGAPRKLRSQAGLSWRRLLFWRQSAAAPLANHGLPAGGAAVHNTCFETLVQQLRESALELQRPPEDPETQSEGLTLLHAAAALGHSCAVQLLALAAGPEAVTSRNRQGCTPVHFAVCHPDMLQLCLAVAPEAASLAANNGVLPIHVAAGQGCTAAVRLLLQVAPHTALVMDNSGSLAAHYAAPQHTAALQLLLTTAREAAAVQDANGSTPLALAAASGHTQGVRLCLHAAAPGAAAVADSTGWLPMHHAAAAAAAQDSTAALQLLLEAWPQAARIRSDDGLVPLHLAAKHGRADAVALLLAAAPDTANVPTDDLWLPCHAAAAGGSATAVQLCLEAAPGTAAARDQQLRTPAWYAAWHGHAAALKLCIDAAPSTAWAPSNTRTTPLHAAARGGHAEAVRLCLQAAPETAAAVNTAGHTPLDLALQKHAEGAEGGTAAARCLLGAGPAGGVLAALRRGGQAALPLVVECVLARAPLSDGEWAEVPAPCSGLGRALPALLACSAAQAQQLVRRLPAGDLERLHTLALCLARVQRRLGLQLPLPIQWGLLSVALDA